MDLSGTSLVGRVCHLDSALSVASNQAGIVQQINFYLDLDLTSLTLDGGLPLGPILCCVCVIIWSLFILRELRGIATLVLGVLNIRRGPTTIIKDGAFVTISGSRVACFLGITVIRVLLMAWGGVGGGMVWSSKLLLAPTSVDT